MWKFKYFYEQNEKNMSSEKLKEHLLRIANDIKAHTRLEDIYSQLVLLEDIEESVEEEKYFHMKR